MNHIFLENKYTKWYYAIVQQAQARNVHMKGEKHHIIPESFYLNRKRKGSSGWLEGDPDEPSNVVTLTYKEHLLCHKLLIKMTVGKAKAKMYHALQVLISNKNAKNITSKQYHLLREGLSASMKDYWSIEKRLERSTKYSNEGNPFFGKNHSTETKEILRDRIIGKTYEELYGLEKAETLRKKVANSGERNGFYGKTHSTETKAKLSKAASKPKSESWKKSASIKRKGRIPVNKNKTLVELYGEDRAEEIRSKISLSGEKNGFYGKTHTLEQRAKKSKEKLDAPKKVCYYCNKSVDHMNYSRWHGQNCKHKK